MSLYSYSPEDVTILLLGFIPVEGYIDGTLISINKDLPPFTSGMTADGVQSRVHRISSSYTMRLVISNVSPTNDVLTKLWQIDEITKMGKFPILVKDQLGTSLFFSATSWIESPPSLYYSNRITEREWVSSVLRQPSTLVGMMTLVGLSMICSTLLAVLLRR